MRTTDVSSKSDGSRFDSVRIGNHFGEEVLPVHTQHGIPHVLRVDVTML